MKQINKYLLILLASMPFLTGCADDDGLSLNKFWVEIATVVPLEGGHFYVKLDDGKKLWPAATNIVSLPYKEVRAQVNYTILSNSQGGEYDHSVKINYINYILTKQIVKEEEDENLGKDRIKILEIWEGDDFLNIHFGVNVGGKGITHTIDLVDCGIDEEGFINLELRHDANGDDESYGAKGLVAFDLRPYQNEEKEAIKFRITLNAFQGSESEYLLVYNYTGTKNPSAHNIVDGYKDGLEFN